MRPFGTTGCDTQFELQEPSVPCQQAVGRDTAVYLRRTRTLTAMTSNPPTTFRTLIHASSTWCVTPKIVATTPRTMSAAPNEKRAVLATYKPGR